MSCFRVGFALFIILFTTNSEAKAPMEFDAKMQALLNAHVNKYSELEYYSGASLSVSIPNQPIRNYYAGRVSHDADSLPIDKNTLFQIGSITKSFTAAVMLQLDGEDSIKLNETLGKWLPEYSKWSSVKIDSLLNMTSGLPNYSDTPLWNMNEYKMPERVWSNKELVEFVYPEGELSPPLKSGYFYTNTGYILADMIVKKVTGNLLGKEMTERAIRAAELSNTFYPVPVMEKNVMARMAASYNYNQYDNPLLVGKEVGRVNLSWAAAAGGIVSNSEDIVKWIGALFIGDKILDAKQKQKLTALFSVATGKPITKTTADDPRAFGLGVIQSYQPDKSIGRMWFYEGETLGFRALYMYTPCNQVIISSIFNSAVNTENDHAHELMVNTYKTVLKEYPALQCH